MLPQDPLARLDPALGGRYRMLRLLGEGGMATVYLAEDLKHDRRVAIKVLKPELAAVVGAERFLSEIKTTANLQHPHILPLFDSGEADGFLFYVMPHVEGESLRDRLNRERQIPVAEAVTIASKLASALDYAHRNNVVHRDIKPANILLHDGEPVLADFGIALAVSVAGGDRITETGTIMGTPHYMSPEQVTGDRVGATADIYALGCVLYEMLAGDPPFMGSTPQAILAQIITGVARPVSKVRASAPPNVEATITKALETIPADRFTRARDFAEALGNPGFRHARRHGTTGPRSGPRLTRERRFWATALLISVLLSAWGWLRPRPPPPVVRHPVAVPLGSLTGTSQRFALSPQGDRLAYIAPDGLWYRDIDVLQPTSVDVSGRVGGVAFSPDGSRIAFSVELDGLFIAATGGGLPVRVAALPEGVDSRFLEWGDDDLIYAEGPEGVVAIRASVGSAWEPVTRKTEGETRHLYPHALPNGRALVFVIRRTGDALNSRIGVVDRATGRHEVLLPGIRAAFSPTGHLVYVTADGGLSAVPFDADRLRVTGRPHVLTGGVRISQFGLGGEISIARNGTLVYVGGEAKAGGAQLVWVDRGGTEAPVDPTWVEAFQTVALAPSGDRVAVSISEGGEEHVWVRSVQGGAVQRLSSAGGRNWRPTWRGDGGSVAYISDRMGPLRAFRRPVDFSGADEELLPSVDGIEEVVWLPDGKSVVYRRGGGVSGGTRDILTAPLGSSEGEPVAATGSDERTPSLSPDGRWLVYRSDASIVVRSLRGEGATWTLATGDLREPLWSPTGDEIFYRDMDRGLVAVTVQTEPTFSVVGSRVLFDMTPYRFESNHRAYDVTRDGRRFLMIREHRSADQLVWVQNFSEELKRRVPN